MVNFKSKQEAAHKVEKWLKEEDYDVTLVPDESADYNFMLRNSGWKIIFTPQEQYTFIQDIVF